MLQGTSTLQELKECLKETINSINGFDVFNNLQEKIARQIEERNVAFLTGAGISLGRSTFAPSWQDMMQTILTEISKITEGHDKPTKNERLRFLNPIWQTTRHL